jgi:hypothetical protein
MFNEIPIKIPVKFIIKIEKSTIKFIWSHKRLQRVKEIEQKREHWRYHNT